MSMLQIEGYSMKKIKRKLNGMVILTSKGNCWSEKTVIDILFSEVHLGRTILGKSSGSRHKNKKITIHYSARIMDSYRKLP